MENMITSEYEKTLALQTHACDKAKRYVRTQKKLGCAKDAAIPQNVVGWILTLPQPLSTAMDVKTSPEPYFP